jgi:hypothetical protein
VDRRPIDQLALPTTGSMARAFPGVTEKLVCPLPIFGRQAHQPVNSQAIAHCTNEPFGCSCLITQFLISVTGVPPIINTI